MNLLAMVRRLHREVRRSGPQPNTLVGAPTEVLRLADWIADAWRELQAEPRSWRWMRRQMAASVEVGASSVNGRDAMADFGRWRRADRTYKPRLVAASAPFSPWTLEWRELDAFRRLLDVPQADGTPGLWTIDNDESMLLLPGAASEMMLRAEYTCVPTELVEDDDTPDMPEKHHMLLVWRAMVESGKSSVAAEDVSRAADHLDEMMATLLLEEGEQIKWASSPLA